MCVENLSHPIGMFFTEQAKKPDSLVTVSLVKIFANNRLVSFGDNQEPLQIIHAIMIILESDAL